MKSIAKFAVLLCALSVIAFAAPNAQESFDKLKSLAGTWEGTSPKGPVTVSYRVMANGSSVVSEITGPEDNMISVFNMDKDRLLMTHYCGAGNQPRMVASTSPDGKILTFDFIDGTNIMPSQAGHMRELVVSMPDGDHHREQWVFATTDGKEMKETFELTRKK
jgi:hypothetical protein